MRAACDNVGCFCTFEPKLKKASICINGEKFELHYFTCPDCKKLYKVVLKNDKIKNLEADLKRYKKKSNSLFSKDNKLSNTYTKLATCKLEELRQEYDAIDQKFTGTFTLAASLNNGKDNAKYFGEVIYTP